MSKVFYFLFLIFAVFANAKELGAMSPKEALEYLKANDDVFIVDVATTRWYNKEHFDGAINIPIEELSQERIDQMYKNIPANRPVILHCRLGMVVSGAYKRLKELRPDIKEISYIDGKPPFSEYKKYKQGKR